MKASNKKEIDFELIIEDNISNVLGDPERVEQILFNILGNALKFTNNGKIMMSVSEIEDEIIISITDTGIGINDKKDIFEPFTQGDNTITREYQGVGLGLGIVKKLIELQNGKIWYESVVNKGTTFYLSLKKTSEDKKEIKLEKNRVIEFDNKLMTLKNNMKKNRFIENKFNILVVDDETINLQIISNILTNNDYVVEIETSSENVIEKVFSKNYDLLLLDVMMPKISGYEITKKIREKYSKIELPIILLTAKSRTQDILIGFEYGANDYIVKPFEKLELVSRIDSLLNLKYTTQEVIKTNEKLSNEKYKTKILKEQKMDIQSLYKCEEVSKLIEKFLLINKRSNINFEIIVNDKLLTKKTSLFRDGEVIRGINFSFEENILTKSEKTFEYIHDITFEIEKSMRCVKDCIVIKSEIFLLFILLEKELVKNDVDYFNFILNEFVTNIRKIELLEKIKMKNNDLQKKNIEINNQNDNIKKLNNFLAKINNIERIDDILKRFMIFLLNEINLNYEKVAIFNSDDNYRTSNFSLEIKQFQKESKYDKLKFSSKIINEIDISNAKKIYLKENSKGNISFIFKIKDKKQSLKAVLVETSRNNLFNYEIDFIELIKESLNNILKNIYLKEKRIDEEPIRTFRCEKCNSKLFVYKGFADFVEVKCKRCNTLNYFKK